MTAENLVRWIESYYGDYRPVVKQEVLGWLDEYREDVLDSLYQTLKETFTNNYRMPPDIAQLTKCLPPIPSHWPWRTPLSLKKQGEERRQIPGRDTREVVGEILQDAKKRLAE